MGKGKQKIKLAALVGRGGRLPAIYKITILATILLLTKHLNLLQ